MPIKLRRVYPPQGAGTADDRAQMLELNIDRPVRQSRPTPRRIGRQIGSRDGGEQYALSGTFLQRFPQSDYVASGPQVLAMLQPIAAERLG